MTEDHFLRGIELETEDEPTPRFAWQLEENEGVVYFRLPANPVAGFFTTRSRGDSRGPYASLNLAFGVGDEPECVQQNLGRVKEALGIESLVTLKQIHSDVVLYINYDRIPPDLLEGDALFTDQPGLALGIRVADCLPIYFFGNDPPVVALAHAGWRGTRSRIAGRLVKMIQRKLGIAPSALRYAFGPGIGASCYEIGWEVAREFQGFPAPNEFLLSADRRSDQRQAADGSGRIFLDLKAANRQILGELGVAEVADLNKCSYSSPGLFFSARRDGATGRNMAIIVRR